MPGASCRPSVSTASASPSRLQQAPNRSARLANAGMKSGCNAQRRAVRSGFRSNRVRAGQTYRQQAPGSCAPRAAQHWRSCRGDGLGEYLVQSRSQFSAPYPVAAQPQAHGAALMRPDVETDRRSIRQPGADARPAAPTAMCRVPLRAPSDPHPRAQPRSPAPSPRSDGGSIPQPQLRVRSQAAARSCSRQRHQLQSSLRAHRCRHRAAPRRTSGNPCATSRTRARSRRPPMPAYILVAGPVAGTGRAELVRLRSGR